MTPIPKSFHSHSPALGRELERRALKFQEEREEAARSQRWGLSFDIQGFLVTEALELSGLKMNPEGDVEPIQSTENRPLHPPRVRLAAMRIIASCDKLVLEQRQIELQDDLNAHSDEVLTPGYVLETLEMSEPMVWKTMELLAPYEPPEPFIDGHPASWKPDGPAAEEPQSVPEPEPDPEPEPEAQPVEELPPTVVLSHEGRDRWPITKGVRSGVIRATLGVYGQAVSSDGKLSPLLSPDGTPQPKPKRRTRLGALWLLTCFDRLSLIDMKLTCQVERQKWKRAIRYGGSASHPDDCRRPVTWELVAMVCEMMEAEALASELILQIT